jgi:hypothetical protein
MAYPVQGTRLIFNYVREWSNDPDLNDRAVEVRDRNDRPVMGWSR